MVIVLLDSHLDKIRSGEHKSLNLKAMGSSPTLGAKRFLQWFGLYDLYGPFQFYYSMTISAIVILQACGGRVLVVSVWS